MERQRRNRGVREICIRGDMKLITFSLSGYDLKYLRGAIKNAELAKKIYPGWLCRFYVGVNTPFGIIHQLKKLDNVQVLPAYLSTQAINLHKSGDARHHTKSTSCIIKHIVVAFLVPFVCIVAQTRN